jgi:hypothetical protein
METRTYPWDPQDPQDFKNGKEKNCVRKTSVVLESEIEVEKKIRNVKCRYNKEVRKLNK